MPEEKIIRVLIIEPMRKPKEMYVPNALCFFKYYVSMGNYYIGEKLYMLSSVLYN